VGFVIPTAAVVWGIWTLWRWSSPGGKRPAVFATGIIEFVLICVLVVLIILGWELFKTWRRQAHGQLSPRTAKSELRPVIRDRRARASYLAGECAGGRGVREYRPSGCPDGSARTAIAPTPSGRLNGKPGTTFPPSSVALLQAAIMSDTWT
jgi:hypothetical protein